MDKANLPRKPQRANGFKKYNLLVDVVDDLFAEEGASGITIQAIAQHAGVPMASVYHFFPSPVAACLALAERHLDELQKLVSQLSTENASENQVDFTLTAMRATVAYYRKHPSAAQLILGPDYSAQIRNSDIAANRLIAAGLSETMVNDFKQAPSKDLFTRISIAIRISDSIWSLSIANKGEITKDYEREAEVAVTAYLMSATDTQTNT